MEDVSFIIESVAQGNSGEAKKELLSVVKSIKATNDLDQGYSKEILSMLEVSQNMLIAGTEIKSAIHRLIRLRRILYNTLLKLNGMKIKYFYLSTLESRNDQAG
ncbi:MAG: hypothetical protein AB7E04_11980 [Desulfobacteraceae bacterium]